MRKVSNPIKILLVLAALLIAGFQNCSGKGILNAGFLSGKSRPGDASGPNQVGLFLLYLEDGTCEADGRPKSAIRFQNNTYLIERLDCEDISPAQIISPTQISLNPAEPLVLYYGGRTFRQR